MNGPNELILSEGERFRISTAQLQLCNGRIINHVAVPTASFTFFSAVCGSACTHTLRLVMHFGGRIAVQREPTTFTDCVGAIQLYTSSSYGDPRDIQKQMRNEVRMQCTLSQFSLAQSVTKLPYFSYASFLSLPCGNEAIWMGDRTLTFKYIFKDEEDLVRVMGSTSILGWQLLTPLATSQRSKSARMEGFLLPFLHDDCEASCITYCLETYLLEVRLSLGLFGTNLEWYKGAMFPARSEADQSVPGIKYDIVTRQWCLPAAVGVRAWTLGRAEDALKGMD